MTLLRAPTPLLRHRTPASARRHGVLAALLVADVATKTAAFHLLPLGDPVTLLPGLRLCLAINEWGVMGGVNGLGPVASRPMYTLALAAGLVVLALSILRLAATGLSFGWRVAAGTAVFLGVACAAEAASAMLPAFVIPADVLVATIRAAALLLALAFYAASRAPRARAPFVLLAAGALANAASFAYPPFAVVDFLVVPLAPLAFLVGGHVAALGEDTVGVINLADACLFAFPLLLLAWPLAALVSSLRRKMGQPFRA